MIVTIRKAVVAGLGAGAAAAFTYLQANSFKLDGEVIMGAIVAFVAAGIPVGYATWKVAYYKKPITS